MSITSGVRLGPYEIIEPVGSGGMGEVYRARDVRLDRDVAVKTIKGPFTERFEREARAISALNDPHICTLHDVGQHEGSGYLVMEFIEGAPIAGPLPLDQALSYGIQICNALHAAHKKGIVHRDLKPANILVTKQGVKLLDFGLAKLATPDPVSAAQASSAVERATVAALTGTHTVVGTPQYMAPEQIEAREVDARTDIFAFGCVLYELLTGRRAFDGQTSSSIMAAVLATKPQPIEELIPLTPPALDRVVSRCLAKDPEDRWQSARDVGAELLWIQQGGSKAGLPAIVSGRRRVRERLAWGACAVAALAAGAFAIAWMRRAPQPPPLVRFQLVIPSTLQNTSPPVISPDGRTIAFAAEKDGQRMIWIRAMDALEPRVLPGTEGVFRPFWSPDSRFVGFIAGTKMKKVDINGGPVQLITDVPSPGGDGSWSPEGVILFDGTVNDVLREVPAGGGVSKPVVLEADKPSGTTGSGWPEFLPDGKHFLYTVGTSDFVLKVGLLGSTTSKTLFTTTTRVQYADPGYLLFVRDRTLVAQKFDPDTQTLEGDPVPLGEGLGTDDVGLAAFSISRTGVLVYRGGELTGSRLVWIDRQSKETPAIDEAAEYHDTWFSPDRTRLAYDVGGDNGGDDIWIRDLRRGVSSRFTFGPSTNVVPVWSPDGRRIVYSSREKGAGDLYIKDASGARDPEPLLVDDQEKYATDWSPDGKYLLFSQRGKEAGGWSIWALPMTGEPKPVPIVKTRFNEMWGTFSPDGRYIAYQSNESGRIEVYVQEFPDARNKWQVSTNGGAEPYWRADGRELFYRSGPTIMVVPVEIKTSFVAGTPAVIAETRFAAVVARGFYRPTPDGQRFLVLAPRAGQVETPPTIVLNWTSALRR
ncbi:MAG TPA: protein kinase [Vicinamibacterales bacterium]|nr:protein kinase [Vicinamibacterales bacterium]